MNTREETQSRRARKTIRARIINKNQFNCLHRTVVRLSRNNRRQEVNSVRDSKEPDVITSLFVEVANLSRGRFKPSCHPSFGSVVGDNNCTRGESEQSNRISDPFCARFKATQNCLRRRVTYVGLLAEETAAGSEAVEGAWLPAHGALVLLEKVKRDNRAETEEAIAGVAATLHEVGTTAHAGHAARVSLE
ncbi:hypothetical protein PGT21_005523 [Puccinia graminis f. sp. tritici]|uniref:Uncharacterized protein n=1 Tax=Puccinia graminis f. sp. tritici TaxID=56615 RepID=A0A5B0QSP6_PUCGR|nr:hypothetical protein PGT21_005523 [Puccinia graminis f. sp. tritici]